MSGSISLTIQSRYHQAVLESPRVKFVDAEHDAKDWRERWEKRHARAMKRVRAILDERLPLSGAGFDLIPYKAKLPLVWSGSSASELPVAVRKGGSCAYTFFAGGIHVTVAFSSLPKADVRRVFEEQVTALLRDVGD